jgi:hypothetical protein
LTAPLATATTWPLASARVSRKSQSVAWNWVSSVSCGVVLAIVAVSPAFWTSVVITAASVVFW